MKKEMTFEERLKLSISIQSGFPEIWEISIYDTDIIAEAIRRGYEYLGTEGTTAMYYLKPTKRA